MTTQDDRAIFETWHKSTHKGYTYRLHEIDRVDWQGKIGEFFLDMLQKEYVAWQAAIAHERQLKPVQADDLIRRSDVLRALNSKVIGLIDEAYIQHKLLATINNIPAISNTEVEAVAIDVDKMVDRFLGWKLPADFSPDCGISFKKESYWPEHVHPIGTNLFNAIQAKAMIEYLLADKT